MSWTKLGDEFSDEAQDLSSDAFRTHVEALLWSNRRLLDLVIPKRDLKRFAESPDPGAAAEELVAAGWWQDAVDSWYVGVHFAEWQQESVVIEHKRKTSAMTTRRNRLHKAGDHSICRPEHCKVAHDRDASPPTSRAQSPGTGRDGTGNPPTEPNYAYHGAAEQDDDETPEDRPWTP